MKNHAAYAASKGGVNSLTGQLALELNPLNIRVVGVAPGSVRTPMTTNDIERDKSLLEELGFPTDGRSIGHVGEPEEIAEVLLWSASSAASFVNGTVITADAGLLARLTFE
jgi:NAD(P)-dependent dehydrogenase (short-subunit alcohol dehydrogenase family)